MVKALLQPLIDTKLVPQGFEEVPPAGGFAADQFELIVLMLDLGAVFWIQKSAYAFDQSLERFDIELVAAAEGVNNLGLGEAFFFVPDVIRKLDPEFPEKYNEEVQISH